MQDEADTASCFSYLDKFRVCLLEIYFLRESAIVEV